MPRRRPRGAPAPPAGAAPGPTHSRPRRAWLLAPFLSLVAVSAFYDGTGMVQAVDTWMSLAAGRHIAARGVDTVDPFCFTSRPAASEPVRRNGLSAQVLAWARPTGWVNQKWLTHWLVYEVFDLGGPGALVGLRFAVYVTLAVLLLAVARGSGASWPASSLATAGALVVSRPFSNFRAQEATLLCTALALVVLARAVRRSRRALWLLVPLIALWCNLHGGFIFGFLALGCYGAAALLASRGRHWLVLDRRGTLTAALVATAAVAISVVASPFRLANLTQAATVAAGPDAALWRRVNEWQPAVTPGARIAEVVPFFVFLGVVVLAVVASAWPSRTGSGAGSRRRGGDEERASRRFDLGSALVAVLAIGLALRSMRFVPLAAVAAAPLLACVLDAAAARARRRFDWSSAVQGGRLVPYLAGVTAAVTVAFAAYCGVRWTHAYQGPWPLSTGPVSLFDRMTWAHRTVGVGHFLQHNALEGRMYNVWEESGALFWRAQSPGSRKPPLLRGFIDCRAQEAFAASAVRDYIELSVGGPPGVAPAAEGRLPRPNELAAMSRWVDGRLKRSAMWVAVLPEERTGDGIARALFSRANWRIAYLDPFHVVLVDTDDPRGKRLDADVEAGKTTFPDESIRALTRAARLLAGGGADAARVGLEEAKRSFALRPTAAAVGVALRAAGAQSLRGEVTVFASRIVADYRAKEESYRHEAGFLERAKAATTAATFLEDEARRAGRDQEADELRVFTVGVGEAYAATLRRVSWWG